MVSVSVMMFNATFNNISVTSWHCMYMIGVDPLCEYFYVEKYNLSIFVKLNACGLNKFAFKYTCPLIPIYCSKKTSMKLIDSYSHL